MDKKKIALILIIIAIGLHAYLSQHFYGLKYGQATADSVCNLSSQFSCDTVSASDFSSLLGAPIALWGLVTNFVLALLLGGWILGWTANSARLGRYAILLAGFIAITSIVMSGISIFLIGSYCLFCIGAYSISFIVFELLRRSQEESDKTWIGDIKDLLGPAKSYLIYLLVVPLLTLFIDKSYSRRFGADGLTSVVKAAVNEWDVTPRSDFSSAAPTLVKGPPDAKLIISEFADFRCVHCKNASTSIKAFTNSRPDVRLQFYVFPLDASCNEALPAGSGDGLSCYLAKQVYCAQKNANKGWELHDFVFSHQEDINRNSSMDYTKNKLNEALTIFGIEPQTQESCITSAETEQAIKAQAKLGDAVGVRGTPSFYANQRKLSGGQLIPVLDAVYKKIKK